MANDVKKIIAEVKHYLPSDIINKLDKEHVFDLLKLAGEGQVEANRLNSLSITAPILGELTAKLIETVSKVTDQAAMAYGKSLDNSKLNFDKTVEALKGIAAECGSDHARVGIAKLIAEAHSKVSDNEADMFSKFAALLGSGLKIAGVATAAVGTIALIALSGGRGGRSA